jgi:hypothetical protein
MTLSQVSCHKKDLQILQDTCHKKDLQILQERG